MFQDQGSGTSVKYFSEHGNSLELICYKEIHLKVHIKLVHALVSLLSASRLKPKTFREVIAKAEAERLKMLEATKALGMN